MPGSWTTRVKPASTWPSFSTWAAPGFTGCSTRNQPLFREPHFATGTIVGGATYYSDVSSQAVTVAGETRCESLRISPPRATE